MRSTFLVALLGYASAQYGKGGAGLPMRTDPIYSCPAGFNLNGKTCEKTITSAPQVVCNQGILQGLECVIETPKTARCPPGTIQQGKNCVQQISAPAQAFCPSGFIETFGGCEMTEQLPLIEVCEIGSREGPQCATVDVAPYNTQQFCPPGFEEHAKGGCWRTTTYDCTPLQRGKGGLALRGLIGKEGGSSAPVTNAKVNVIQQTCERKEGAAYITERSCPGGFTDNGSGCMVKNYFPTTQRCSNGGPIEACFTTRAAPLNYTCPAGTQQNGQACISTVSQPEETFCSIGFDNGLGCIQTFAPQQVCPGGLTLSGGICLGQETAPPQVTVTVTCTGKNCHH